MPWKEFPNLKEWWGDHLWAPGCYHGSVGNGLKLLSSISQHIIHISITGDNPGKRYIQALDVCPGYTGDCGMDILCILHCAN